MKLNFSRRVARLARYFGSPLPQRPVGRPSFRPGLEGLEDRALLSTLSVVHLDHSGPGSPRGVLARADRGDRNAHMSGASSAGLRAARPAGTAASAMVFRAADVPQRVDFPDVFTVSSIDVPQGVTIASLKVQLDITYPLDNDLTIDLIAPDGTDVPLSSFEGNGANFQNTTFDDKAATPIWAGDSPFAGSYRPEGPLSSVAGMNAQGTWELEIIDWGASSGTLNSWSLIIQPAVRLVPTDALPLASPPAPGSAGATAARAPVTFSSPDPVMTSKSNALPVASDGAQGGRGTDSVPLTSLDMADVAAALKP
jgi:subtilisin-like proprotein convertase family protein